MNRYFNIFDLYKQRNNGRLYSSRFERLHFYKVNNLKELCGRLPLEEEIFFIETKKSFNAFTFIVYLIKNAGKIENLFIATYSINDRIINALTKWQEKGLIDNITIEISASIKFRMPKIYERLNLLSRNGKINKVTYEWTHRKVTCVDTHLSKFVIEGSGNYGENALLEQYVFCKSEKVYEFRNNKTSNLG